MTRASDLRPTVRVLLGGRGTELVYEIRAGRITIRPLGCRRGGPAEVEVTPLSIYEQALIVRANRKRAERLARRQERRR